MTKENIQNKKIQLFGEVLPLKTKVAEQTQIIKTKRRRYIFSNLRFCSFLFRGKNTFCWKAGSIYLYSICR